MSHWIERAVEFTQSLSHRGTDAYCSTDAASPLTASQLCDLQSTLDSKIPDSLVDFLCTESSSCNCEYYLTFKHKPQASVIEAFGAENAVRISETNIYGGASLCQSEFFADWNSEGVLSWFDDIDEECAHLWRNTFIFKFIANGDWLGLFVEDDTTDPPVVYLDHESEIYRPIAPSLNHFLSEWEKLWYIGPEYWELQDFIDSDTGYINAKVGNLTELRSRFSGKKT